jgi:hypothetical protein
MANQVCMGAMLKCSFGMAPGTLMVLPTNLVMTKVPDANIMDNKPMLNIMPFGMCQSMANPMVIAATAAALGALTPMHSNDHGPLGPWLTHATSRKNAHPQ